MTETTTLLDRDPETDLDAGPRAGAAGTERFCVATSTVKPVTEMIRFVLDPAGSVTPDLKQKLPGRGLWVTATHEALGTAIKRRAFTRSFKRDVTVRPDLAAWTDALLERAALEALAMVNKAGRGVTGFSKVEAALDHDHVVGVLHAAEAAADGVRKIDGAARRRAATDGSQIAQMRTFTASQMDLAFGRPNVVHAALLASPASETFLARAARLDRFRAESPVQRGVRDGS